MTYCFVCRACGAKYEGQTRGTAGELELPCANCGGKLRRDYVAEGVGLGSGVKVSRDGLVSDQAALFLPSNKDFAGPKDPDGTKGMRAWRESHEPRDSNNKPHWPGQVEKRTF